MEVGLCTLDETHCWRISGVRSGEEFFRAILPMVPDATRVFLEGAPATDVLALVAPHVDDVPYAAPVGTFWSWPRNRRITLRASPTLLTELARAAACHAEPEICTHLHVYRGDEPLVQWFDAFDDPILVSKTVPREAVQRFCDEVGGVLSDGAAPSARNP
jgi:hypothetical protein